MKTHRPCLWILLSLIFGILYQKFYAPPFYIWLVVLCVLFLSALMWRRRIIDHMVICLMLCVVGILIMSLSQQEYHGYRLQKAMRYFKGDVWAEGIVWDDTVVKDSRWGMRSRFRIKTLSLSQGLRSVDVQAFLSVMVFRRIDLHVGDVIRLQGKIHRPYHFSSDGRLSYADYLKRKDITMVMSVKKNASVILLKESSDQGLLAYMRSIRRGLNDIFDRYLSSGEAGLMKSLMTGERSGIPPHMRELLSSTGTIHVISISGLHVGIIAGLLYFLATLLPFPKAVRSCGVIGVLILFALMTGARPPVVRAVIMSSVFLISSLLGREQDGVNTLSFAAVLLLLTNPQQIGDVGFQLSFTSVLAIILMTPIFIAFMHRWEGLWSHHVLRYVCEGIAVSLAAFLGVLGLIVFYFYDMTPVAILANIPIVPLVGLATVLGVLLLCLHSVSFLAVSVAAVLKVVLNGLAFILYGLAHLPYGQVKIGRLSWQSIVVYYGVLLVFILSARWLFRKGVSLDQIWQNGV